MGDQSQRRWGMEASSGRTIARRGVRASAAPQPRAATSPSHAEGDSTEPEHQLHASSRLTARPRPQQPEPELQWAATTERGVEGKLGRAQTPHPGRLGLARPRLRCPSWPRSCVERTSRGPAASPPVSLEVARIRPFPLIASSLADTSLLRSLAAPQIPTDRCGWALVLSPLHSPVRSPLTPASH